jgi:hypothetical protein
LGPIDPAGSRQPIGRSPEQCAVTGLGGGLVEARGLIDTADFS